MAVNGPQDVERILNSYTKEERETFNKIILAYASKDFDRADELENALSEAQKKRLEPYMEDMEKISNYEKAIAAQVRENQAASAQLSVLIKQDEADIEQFKSARTALLHQYPQQIASQAADAADAADTKKPKVHGKKNKCSLL